MNIGSLGNILNIIDMGSLGNILNIIDIGALGNILSIIDIGSLGNSKDLCVVPTSREHGQRRRQTMPSNSLILLSQLLIYHYS